MPWLMVIATLMWLTACPSEAATVAPTLDYVEETLASDDVGFWPVYDTDAFPTADANKTKANQDHPSCLLLKMKVVVYLGNTTIVDVPRTAKISNDTCLLPEEDHINDENYVDYTFTPQSAQLSWPGQDGTNSSLVMTFKSGPFGQGNQGYNEWFWLSALSLKTPSVTLTVKKVRGLAAPMLFAFRCKGKALSFKATAKVNGKKKEVVVTFHHLEVEPFRTNRYYESLTHLKWDCLNGWPYSYVPALVSLLVVIMAAVVGTGMFITYRKASAAEQEEEEGTENLVPAEGAAGEEEQDSLANTSAATVHT